MSQEEYKNWYTSCEFIQREMQFYSFPNFIEEAFGIRRLYEELDNRTKKLYQWYIFANHITYAQKCLIWNFLNGYNSYEDLLSNIKRVIRTKK